MLIEARMIAYLARSISGVTVAAEVPAEFPAGGALIVVERLGETTANRLKTARLAVQSYGDTLLHAAERNAAAIAALEDYAAQESRIASCKVDTSYNFTDETRKRYRYQAVVYVTYYEED